MLIFALTELSRIQFTRNALMCSALEILMFIIVEWVKRLKCNDCMCMGVDVPRRNSVAWVLVHVARV